MTRKIILKSRPLPYIPLNSIDFTAIWSLYIHTNINTFTVKLNPSTVKSLAK